MLTVTLTLGGYESAIAPKILNKDQLFYGVSVYLNLDDEVRKLVAGNRAEKSSTLFITH